MASSDPSIFSRMSPRLWLGLAVAVVVVAFIVQNREPIDVVTLFFVTVTAPQWMTLAVVFAAGLASGWLIARRRA